MITDTEKINLIKKAFGKKFEVDSTQENYTFVCPNKKCGSHAKGKLKFVVRVKDSACHCWVCGLKGRNAGYIIKNYAVHLLDEFQRVYQVKHENRSQDQAVEIEEKHELPQDFRLLAELISEGQLKDPDHVAVYKYLASRNLTIRDLWRYKVGVASGGKFHRAAIFPSFNSEGEFEFAVLRKINPELRMKYFNIGKKSSQIIFNEIHVDFNQRIYLFEGVFDLIRSGLNGTCILGSSLAKSGSLYQKLISKVPPVTICLDADARAKSIKIAQDLVQYGLDVKITNLPEDTDPGSLPKDELHNHLHNAVSFAWQDSITNKIKSIRSGSIL